MGRNAVKACRSAPKSMGAAEEAVVPVVNRGKKAGSAVRVAEYKCWLGLRRQALSASTSPSVSSNYIYRRWSAVSREQKANTNVLTLAPNSKSC